MGRRTAAVAGCAALVLALSPGGVAQAATAGTCSWTGRITVSPGLTFSPRDFRFSLDGQIDPCRMPNRETRSGSIVVSKGTGHGGCGSAKVETPFTVSWDGGRKQSTGHASGVTSGPFGFVTGTLDGGDYAGTPFQTYIVLNPRGPLSCSYSGVTTAELYGQITFR